MREDRSIAVSAQEGLNWTTTAQDEEAIIVLCKIVLTPPLKTTEDTRIKTQVDSNEIPIIIIDFNQGKVVDVSKSVKETQQEIKGIEIKMVEEANFQEIEAKTMNVKSSTQTNNIILLTRNKSNFKVKHILNNHIPMNKLAMPTTKIGHILKWILLMGALNAVPSCTTQIFTIKIIIITIRRRIIV